MTFSLALDVFVSGLLVITIGLAAVLNHRLGKLRRERSDLERLTSEFQDATARASDASRHLTVDAESLRDGIDKAQSLKEDLAFLTERAGGAADRLENQIRSARNPGERPASAPRASVPPASVPRASVPLASVPLASTTQASPPKMRIAANAEQPSPRSQAERDLLQALRSAN